jgi:hypothetical protein
MDNSYVVPNNADHSEIQGSMLASSNSDGSGHVAVPFTISQSTRTAGRSILNSVGSLRSHPHPSVSFSTHSRIDGSGITREGPWSLDRQLIARRPFTSVPSFPLMLPVFIIAMSCDDPAIYHLDYQTQMDTPANRHGRDCLARACGIDDLDQVESMIQTAYRVCVLELLRLYYPELNVDWSRRYPRLDLDVNICTLAGDYPVWKTVQASRGTQSWRAKTTLQSALKKHAQALEARSIQIWVETNVIIGAWWLCARVV